MKKKLLGGFAALLLGSALFLFTSGEGNHRAVVLETPPPSSATGAVENASPLESFLSIPISITADEAVRILEDALANPLYDIQGQILDQSYGQSMADILLEKTGAVTVGFEEDTATFSLPFRFFSMVSWRGRVLGIASSTRKEIFGAGVLRLMLAPSIDEEWRIRLNGSVALEWTRAPALNILGQNIGIASLLSDIFHKRSGELLTRAEEAINRSVRLRDSAEAEWKKLHTPLHLSSSPELWLSVTPLSVSMPPFSARNGLLTATAGIQCLLEIAAEPPEAAPPTPLPGLAPMPPHVEPGILLNVESTLSYEALGRYVSSVEIGDLRMPGRGNVTVNEVSFFGSGDRLVAAADISGRGPAGGSLEGTVYIMGKPVYCREEEVIRMEDADFEEQTNSALTRAAAWLARPALLSELTERMVFPLKELREQTTASLTELLQEQRIAQDILMKGEVSALSLERLFLTEEGLRLSFSLGGSLGLRYEDESPGRSD